MVANAMLVMRFHNYTGWGEGLAYLMVFAFFLVLFIQSCMSLFPLVYWIFDVMFQQPLVWFQLLGVTAFCILLEYIYKNWSQFPKLILRVCYDEDDPSWDANEAVFKEADQYKKEMSKKTDTQNK